ncbi:hypothetical protein ACFX11_031915 [Malus domestica]
MATTATPSPTPTSNSPLARSPQGSTKSAFTKLTSANSSPLTPLGFLERAATVYGDCPSVIYGDTTYTWTQTHRRCLYVASSISSLGIKTGNVVSVLSPNIPAMYELHFAVPMSGAILNNINTRQKQPYSEANCWDGLHARA